MATNYYSQSSFVCLLLLSILVLLSLSSSIVNSETTSFEFTKFNQVQKNIKLQGDAVIIPQTNELQLTSQQGGGQAVVHSVGRALYAAPIHIWDKETDTIASFQTNFSFVIHAADKTKTADGLAFFLAPVDTQPTLVQHGNGGLLGIFQTPESVEKIVAVEFDTFVNPWDPEYRHIALDFKTIKSTKDEPWTLSNGKVADVSITYDANKLSLTVSLKYPSQEPVILKDRVDLSAALDEWVSVGFSATSGDSADHVEAHHVISWSFHSDLPDSFDANRGGHFKNTGHLSSYVLQA